MERQKLHTLLDWVESLFFGDLHLGVCPSGDFDDHYRLSDYASNVNCKLAAVPLQRRARMFRRRTVQDGLGLIGEEWDIAVYSQLTLC